MAKYLRVDGDYTIEGLNSSEVMRINYDELIIDGNVTITGSRTEVESTVTTITDPFITLADGNDGTQNGGIEVMKDAAAGTKAGLRYNIADSKWQVSTDFSTWSDLATGSASAGGANTQVQFNDAGSFGGEANFTYDKTSNTLTLDGAYVLGDQGSVPSSVASSTVLYANAAGSGGTGLYFVDGTTSDELVSKSKAVVFGIIF